MRLVDFLFNTKVVQSRSEARGLMLQEAVKVDDLVIKSDIEIDLDTIREVQVGKRITINNEGVVTKKDK